MPSLDAYVGLQLDDQDGIEAWLLAHWMRHQSYSYAASLQGVSVTNYSFANYPDDTWFQQNAQAHYDLQKFMPPDQSVSLNLLTQYSWDNDEDFQTWMQMETLIHRRLDESFGIFG